MRRVILESPFAGRAPAWADRLPLRWLRRPLRALDRWRNVRYARACLRDALLRGEAPLASHLLYTQPGVLDDDRPEERQLGVAAGLAWLDGAQATVVYTDRGISAGMHHGIRRAGDYGRPVEMRCLKRR